MEDASGDKEDHRLPASGPFVATVVLAAALASLVWGAGSLSRKPPTEQPPPEERFEVLEDDPLLAAPLPGVRFREEPDDRLSCTGQASSEDDTSLVFVRHLASSQPAQATVEQYRAWMPTAGWRPLSEEQARALLGRGRVAFRKDFGTWHADAVIELSPGAPGAQLSAGGGDDPSIIVWGRSSEAC